MFGHPHYGFDVIGSTNDFAKHLVTESTPEGTLVSTFEQSEGRGRLGRQWFSEKGKNVLVSYILYPHGEIHTWKGLPFLCAIAVADAITIITQLHPTLKWPNDVLIHEKKVAGILIETGSFETTRFAIIGIGLNVNQAEFPGGMILKPTSLKLETKQDWSLDLLITSISHQLEIWYKAWSQSGLAYIIAEWKKRSDMLGKKIFTTKAETRLCGVAKDIDDDGNLILIDDAGVAHYIFSGDIGIESNTA